MRPLQNAFERNSSVTFSLVVCIFPIMVGRSSTFHNCLTFDFSDFEPFFSFFEEKFFGAFQDMIERRKQRDKSLVTKTIFLFSKLTLSTTRHEICKKHHH